MPGKIACKQCQDKTACHHTPEERFAARMAALSVAQEAQCRESETALARATAAVKKFKMTVADRRTKMGFAAYTEADLEEGHTPVPG